MVKKIISTLVSTRFTAFLFISFSVAMAAGTFIESFHGTDASKILVYNAFWFEIMMILFVVNFIILVLFFNYNATACSNIKFAKKDIFIVNEINNQKIKFNVELADTDLKRKTGLQCKKKMKLNQEN